MNRFLLRRAASLIAALFTLTLFSISASATTYTGTVRNGTTGKVAAGVDVILINLQGNMETVANTKTDAQGNYKFDYSPTGQLPMLIRATYKGVLFHAMLPPGSTTADVQIYDASSDSHTVTFPSRLIVFQPNGTSLIVGEEYEVQNASKPPVAYFKQAGDFEFLLPDGSDQMKVSAQGPEHNPVTQGTIDRGKNRYAIAYGFRPGDSTVLLSYVMPYAGNKATIQLPTVNAADRVFLLAPPSVSITSPGFQPAGTEQGMNVYAHDAITAGTTIEVSVSGTAPAPTDAGAQQGSPDSGASARDTGEAVAAVPPRLDTLKWILLGGFASLFFLGAAFLLRKPLPVAATAGAGSLAPLASPTLGKRAAKLANAEPEAQPQSQTLGAVDREVGASLDELKDTLFKLELRHQAGTISDEDYAAQRARAEKILRDLVRG